MIKTMTIIFILTMPLSAFARSEITGYMSNNPNDPSKKVDIIDESTDSSSGGTAGKNVSMNNKAEAKEKNEIKPEEDKPVVLGFDRLPSGTLVRDESGRVYIIRGDIKQVIWDLDDLKKYAGQVILDLPDNELSEYPTRRFYDNKLIRMAGDRRVFVVKKGRKKHIRSLEELKLDYFGQKIYNLEIEEFRQY